MSATGLASRRVCLLRGVNVGGVKFPMAELKLVALGAGFNDPRTLLTSGNLVIDSDAAPADIEAALEAALLARFGRRIDVVVRTPGQWTALVAANPFPAETARDGSRLLAMVMKTGIKPGAVGALRAFAVGEEKVEAPGDALYFWHPDGMGRSLMAARALPRLTGLGTGRNWNTVLKLASMVGV